jgi:hypothetical protein
MGVGKTLLSDAIEKEVALTLTCSAVLVDTSAVSYVATIERHRESNQYGYDDWSQCHDIKIKNYIILMLRLLKVYFKHERETIFVPTAIIYILSHLICNFVQIGS